MKWEGRLEDKGKRKKANYSMNSHVKNQAYNIPFVRRESFLGHSLEQLDFALVLEVSSILSSHVSMQYKFY